MRLRESTKGLITEADVLWVLTVPAIWSPGAKQLMREAAKLGLGAADERLVLALESEAASVCCRNREMINHPDELKAGAQWIVLDCGGGTVDVTCHRSKVFFTLYFAFDGGVQDAGGWIAAGSDCGVRGRLGIHKSG